MGKANFSDDFKRDAFAQITEQGYRAAEVSQRLGVSQHRLTRSEIPSTDGCLGRALPRPPHAL